MTKLTRLLAHEMAARLRAGDVSSRDLTEAHLAAAEAGNPTLNAWLSIDRDRALGEADAADGRIAAARADGSSALSALPPLAGIPVALKDLVSVKGGQCTAGSKPGGHLVRQQASQFGHRTPIARRGSTGRR